jgi:hypothetical protein
LISFVVVVAPGDAAGRADAVAEHLLLVALRERTRSRSVSSSGLSGDSPIVPSSDSHAISRTSSGCRISGLAFGGV